MKYLIVLILVVVSASSSFAEINPKVSIESNKTLVLNLNDWNNTNNEIVIREINGEVLYSEKSQIQNLSSTKFNLKNLPNGNYELIIKNDIKKALYSMTVSLDGVKMASDQYKVIFKPRIVHENNFIIFSQLALGRDITFSISDKTGTFYSKKYKNEGSIITKFSVKELARGEYTLSIVGENQNDTFSFKK